MNNRRRTTCDLLGYPPDARLLLLNADDFGFCHAVNEGVVRVLEAGVVRSTTIMVPCPWAPEALEWLGARPDQPFGLHLTAVSDAEGYRFGPMAGPERVRSLVDQTGRFRGFWPFHDRLEAIDLAELETEFRAQIELVLAAVLRPTHLDWHSIRIDRRPEIGDLLLRLARAYEVALRVRGRAWIAQVQALGLPCNDHDFLDSYADLDPARKPEQYEQLLRELPEGLSEWAIHPGIDSAELLAIEPSGTHDRQADYEFWTSPRPAELIAAEGVIVLDYRSLRAAWLEH